MTSPLLCLPQDALRAVLEFLEPMDLASMWLCGSTKLNWALSEGGTVENFAINYDYSTYVLAWPPIVKHFSKLHSFALMASGYCAFKPISTEQVLTLPGTLKSLVVDWWGGLESLSEALRLEPARFAQLERLEIYEHLEFDPETSNEIAAAGEIDRHVSFGANLPRGLKTLVITFSDLGNWSWMRQNSIEELPELEIRLILNELPPGLTDLTICSLPFQLDSQMPFDVTIDSSAPHSRCPRLHQSPLPSTLQTLHIMEYFESSSFSDWSYYLPCNLLVLQFSMTRAQELGRWKALPRSLEMLLLVCDIQQASDITTAHLAALPERLSTLNVTLNCRVENVDLEALLAVLPETLESLSGNLFEPSDTLSQCAIERLPRKLTNYPSKLGDWTFMSVLPPRLARIVLPNDAQLPSERQRAHIPNLEQLRLPCGIEMLRVEHLDEPMSKILQKLPRLTNLSLSGRPTPISYVLLPSSVQNLTIHAITTQEGMEDLQLLPRGVTSLSLYFSDSVDHVVDARATLGLPRTLAYLCISALAVDTVWLSGLPSALVHLSISLNLPPTPEMMAALNTTCPELSTLVIFISPRVDSFEWMGELPERLTKFHLSASSKKRLDADTVAKLPRNLVSLSFMFEAISEECAKALPRTLKVLSFGDSPPPWFSKMLHNRI